MKRRRAATYLETYEAFSWHVTTRAGSRAFARWILSGYPLLGAHR